MRHRHVRSVELAGGEEGAGLLETGLIHTPRFVGALDAGRRQRRSVDLWGQRVLDRIAQESQPHDPAAASSCNRRNSSKSSVNACFPLSSIST